MNYLLDRKNKQKKFIFAGLGLAVLLILFFGSSIFFGLSYTSHVIFRPALVLGNKVGGMIAEFRATLKSKATLFSENENLQSELAALSAKIANYNSVLDENIRLKEILGRIDGNEDGRLTVAGILARPDQSPYDTLIVDIGSNYGTRVGNLVFAFGSVPIGRVAEVFPASSKVVLFSNSEEKTDVIISPGPSQTGVGRNVSVQVIGRGGGNFEMVLPRDFVLEKGAEVVLPGIRPYIVATVQAIISDPRDSFQKALLASPVNIQELKFVQVAI